MINRSLTGEIRSYIYLGLKFGIIGSVIGFVLHSAWGSLDEVKYTVINGFIIGFCIGFAEIIFSNSKVVRLPYILLLFIRTISYFLITIISIYSLLIIYLKSIGLGSGSLADPQKFKEISSVYFLTNINILYLMILIFMVSFFWQLKSFFGKGVLINYLTGKYHKPISENRIFMFLDLNNATTLAEKLGSKKFSSFLSDFFNDLDIAFTKTKGMVFQYVGDEVVIIWKLKNGLKNNNCINSYLLALDILDKRKEYYLSNYNTIPSFKASLHLGEVTITEIGVSKKEIVYHGDTINTASRICSKAHLLGKNILISKAVHDRLPMDNEVDFIDLGEHNIKGKSEKIHIYSI